MPTSILIADDDSQQRRYLSAALRAADYEPVPVAGGREALRRVREGGIALMLLDLGMPDMGGFEVLRRLGREKARPPVIVLTADGSIARAVEAMQAGASDFLVKPAGPERLAVSIRNALAMNELSTELGRLVRAGENRLAFSDLVAESPRIREAIMLAQRVARSDIPVLIEGESGTGKEVFARAIHGSSARAGGPFVAVNCGALPASLVESILFGHEKGAFTGAVARRRGRFQEADGGTLFLDEIGELPPDAQVKLLRAIQAGEVDPVGAPRPVKVDIRLVSATNRGLAGMIATGTFREDLFYRIGAFLLHLPPLRDRREDLPGLARMFLKRFAAAEGVSVGGFTNAARDAIRGAPWPGNVRQLENAIHRAVIMADGGLLRAEDLPPLDGPAIARMAPEIDGSNRQDPFLRDDGHVRRLPEIEAETIRRALARYGGRMSETARRLGIGRSTLYRKLGELRVEGPVGQGLGNRTGKSGDPHCGQPR